MVRVAAIRGVCRVLCYYWELVPVAVIKQLLTKLVSDLCYDVSSDAVRIAVLQVSQSLFYTFVPSNAFHPHIPVLCVLSPPYLGHVCHNGQLVKPTSDEGIVATT